ncbi:MAG TPA: hypothetical protein VGN23_16495 [Verrucomicrobiae bacterium]|jgi:hypothetical protein
MIFKPSIFAMAFAALLSFSAQNLYAWDYEGHHAINELAIDSLPSDFGIELSPALKERIAYLAGEPDRWRNSSDRPFEQDNAIDHYIDLEDLKLYDLTPQTLPPLRYDFVAAILKARAAHPERFVAVGSGKNAYEFAGFLPWAIAENYEKLKSDFTTLKVLRNHGGTPVEIANAEADCAYVMGVMGHYVGDGSQPLHTSKYFNGWDRNDNPKHYTTRTTFHAWIDGGYFKKIGGIKVDELSGRIQPASHIPDANHANAFFQYVVNYLVEQNKYVESLYEMDRNGQLTGIGDRGMEGKEFLDGQLVKAGQMLGNLWLTAWQDSSEDDTYLERQLQQRNAATPAY